MVVYSIKTKVELKGLATTTRDHETGSDFVVTQLARLIDVPERNRLVVDKWLELSTRGFSSSSFL